MIGFCWVDENPFGPVQLYDAPLLENRFKAVPAQTGVLLEAVGAGVAFTWTKTEADAEQLDAFVTVTVYVPVAAVGTLEIVGFC
jgi:hypothetical protein